MCTEILMDELLHRVPALEKAEIRQMVNGAESFTPDAHPILGEAPEVLILSSLSCVSHLPTHTEGITVHCSTNITVV